MTTAATTASKAHFDRQYQTHLKHLKLKGLQPKTIDAYSRAIRRIGLRFDHQIDSLAEAQLADYFTELITLWAPIRNCRNFSGVKVRFLPLLSCSDQRL